MAWKELRRAVNRAEEAGAGAGTEGGSKQFHGDASVEMAAARRESTRVRTQADGSADWAGSDNHPHTREMLCCLNVKVYC